MRCVCHIFHKSTPAYACVESNTKLEIKAEPYANITFKNERGVPVLCKDGILEVTARGEPQPGETPVYAHMAETDSTTKVVGKLNLLTFENKIQVCLVPINDVQNDEETNRRCIVV